jgi:hypothetical protein
MRLTFEEIVFLIQTLYAAHGSSDEHCPCAKRRQAADLIDRLGAEAVTNHRTPPDFGVSRLSGELRKLADKDEQIYGL